MPERRVTVWVQRFKDRKHLMLQWIDPETGRRRSKSAETDDEKEAEQARADKEYELNHGLHAEPSKMTWERFREMFEEEFLPSRREKTRENFHNTLNLFEELVRPKTLRQINQRTVSVFVAEMRKRPGRVYEVMAPSTIKVHLQFLHTTLSWAAGQKFLPAVPAFPSIKVPRRKPKPVAVEAFERLAEKAPDLTMRAYLLTAWLAGLRLTEAYHLSWRHSGKAPYVSDDRKRIILPAEMVKADEDQWVPLDPELRAALEQLPVNDDGRVFQFVGRHGRPILPGSVGDRVARLAKKAGVRLTYHTLRKGFGCRYAGKVPAQVLQRLMRHASIKVTMDYYANVDEAVMEAVFGPQRNSSRNSPEGRRQDSTEVRPTTPEVDGTSDRH